MLPSVTAARGHDAEAEAPMRTLTLCLLAGCTSREQGITADPERPEPQDTDCEATWWRDADQDGFGDAAAPQVACHGPEGHVDNAADCEDDDPTHHPGAFEPPDGWDWNCDGLVTMPASVEFVSDGTSDVDMDWQQAVPEETPAVRIFGVYESDEPIEVSIEVAQPTYVALVSAAGASWRVTEKYPGFVLGVLLLDEHGYSSVVEAPPSAVVDTWSYPYQPTFDALSEGGRRLVEQDVWAWYGIEPSSTWGANALREPYIGVRGLATPPWEPSWPQCDGYVPTTFPEAPDLSAVEARCPKQTAESAWCVTTEHGEVRAIGLDSFTTCGTDAWLDGGSPGTSIAVAGGDLYACGADAILTRLALDGSEDPDHAFYWCESLAYDDGHLMTVHSYRFSTEQYGWRWGSWENAQCGAIPPDTALGPLPGATLAASDGILYSAWHSGSDVDMLDPQDGGAWLGSIALEGYDGWIHGLSVVDELLVVLERGDAVRVHDRTTGELLRRGEISDSASYVGLACFVP
jgi:hypothetical protein